MHFCTQYQNQRKEYVLSLPRYCDLFFHASLSTQDKEEAALFWALVKRAESNLEGREVLFIFESLPLQFQSKPAWRPLILNKYWIVPEWVTCLLLDWPGKHINQQYSLVPSVSRLPSVIPWWAGRNSFRVAFRLAPVRKRFCWSLVSGEKRWLSFPSATCTNYDPWAESGLSLAFTNSFIETPPGCLSLWLLLLLIQYSWVVVWPYSLS